MKILKYDNTFEGFLTAVFEVYEQRLKEVKIARQGESTQSFFDNTEIIASDAIKAERVWKGLKKLKCYQTTSTIYKCFLSELPSIENTILNFIKKTFAASQSIVLNYSDEDVMMLAKIVKNVDREKHRMDAFVRFRLTKDNIYFATIEPDFNVLPLNSKHFQSRYVDQKWIIYDLKRDYGLYYNLITMETIQLEMEKNINSDLKADLYFSEGEMEFQQLWKHYFKSTNIASRKNMQLHIKHVPKRYWKYLSEKQP